ncbi:MAG TPA: potassium-transporting ATPase subunit KdpC [Rudaea sp.]|jgi:K+-transporting ATPase ATPase C chain|nr:potassium-transporting ATPase subunit KdpC [Rudaea sp.]
MKNLLRPAIVLLLCMTFITGVVYPVAVTLVAQLVFHDAANGSVIIRNDHALGSHLIGQPFDDPKYFWGRPSATAPFADNSASSGASNFGPTNAALVDAVRTRVNALRAADRENTAPVPIDLVTASASGLDPDISPAAAQFQVARIARIRATSAADIAKMISSSTERRQFGVLGEPRINVLELNLRLDGRL